MQPEQGDSQTGEPLLTIAIPTYNRAGYLAQNLDQLHSELARVDASLVDILVSDNCSPDDTPGVVERAKSRGMPIRYVRNDENLGWGRNFAQCFELARGSYTLLLGDDDVLVDGALPQILAFLGAGEFGLVLLRPYGFDVDFRREYPGDSGKVRRFRDANDFLVTVGALVTLTSACVFNRSLIAHVDARQFSAGDLGALPLALRAALAAPENLFVDRYLIGCKRQNSFNYDYSKVFVEEMWAIMDAHVNLGLRPDAIRKMEDAMLLSYYPFYLFDMRRARRADPRHARKYFAARFGGRWRFRLWAGPILWLPRPLALAWGAFTTLVGRSAAGELGRGLAFARARLRAGSRRSPAQEREVSAA